MASGSEHRMHLGLLVIRVAVAVMTAKVAVGGLAGGRAGWAAFAAKLPLLKAVDPGPVSGLVLLILLCLGALSLATGYAMRLTVAIYTAVYGALAASYWSAGYSSLPVYALTQALICLGLLLAGPGKYALRLRIEKT